MENKPIRIFNIQYSQEDKRLIHKLVDRVIDEAFLSNHTLCRELENKINQIQNSKFCITTSSATSGLEAVFRTIDVNNKAVIVQSNTFIATAHAIQAAGGIIIPLDLDEQYVASYQDLLVAKEFCKKRNLEIGAVCVVNIAGRASDDLFKIRDFLINKNIPLVEDNAQGFLSKLNNNSLGTIGDFSATSFQTTKVVACGEGGAVNVKEEKEANKIRNNIFYGKSDKIKEIFDKTSGNFKLSELNAALTLADLERCKERIKRRQDINTIYANSVNSEYCKILIPPKGNEPSCYKTIFMAKDKNIRKEIEIFFASKNIAMTGSVYRTPISHQPRVFNSNYLNRDLPYTEKFCTLHFAPPNYPELTNDEVYRVVEALNTFQI